MMTHRRRRGCSISRRRRFGVAGMRDVGRRQQSSPGEMQPLGPDARPVSRFNDPAVGPVIWRRGYGRADQR